MAWTDEMVDQLREMWKQGLTTGEIGKRLGVSKNSIVGKVHRLGLSGRPSPIKKKESSSTDETPAVVSTDNIPEKAVPQNKKEKKISIKKVQPEPEPAPVVIEEVDEKIVELSVSNTKKSTNGKTMLTDLDNHTCRWPIGDPKDENFHFCGKKVRIGQTYCDEHAAIAYVKAAKK